MFRGDNSSNLQDNILTLHNRCLKLLSKLLKDGQEGYWDNLYPHHWMLSKKAIDAIKAKPLEDRVKTQMTVTEPRVLCVSVFDNGPVHMLDTIHTSAGIITIAVTRRASFVPSTTVASVARASPSWGYEQVVHGERA